MLKAQDTISFPYNIVSNRASQECEENDEFLNCFKAGQSSTFLLLTFDVV